jgi:hypothetical protein
LFTDARVRNGKGKIKNGRKNKKNKKCVCVNKNNINLLVYLLTPESGINTGLNLYYFYSLYFILFSIKIKNVYA